MKSISFQVLVVIVLLNRAECSVTFVKDLIQFNVAGHPVLHKDTQWNFDPEIGQRRSRLYQQVNGRLGEKAIERLGLGIDGYDLERLAYQRTRDEGQLNGLTEQ